MKAPFPWFGGKAPVAPQVWAALGDVPNYVEPFLGSGAVFLARPHPHKIATLNDKDALVVNFYRAVKYAPRETAEWAAWPVTESDKHAREVWILSHLPDLRPRLEADPEFYDAQMAGWWVYGVCLQIGGGWCDGKGAWVVDEGRLVKKGQSIGITRKRPHLADGGMGIHRIGITRKRPHLTDRGKGIHRIGITRGRPHLADGGMGIHRISLYNKEHENHNVIFNQARTESLIAYFNELAERFATARIICGDWTRVVGPAAIFMTDSPTGIFLDPPYKAELRSEGIYREDADGLAEAVREWCLDNGNDPRLRIVLAGYAGEGHEILEEKGWKVMAWKARGGYANLSDECEHKANKYKERLWISPHCLYLGDLFQMG